MLAPRRNSPDRTARRGSAAFEALLILPLVLGVIFGGAGLADLVITEQAIDEAGGRAGRTAAMTGSKSEVRKTVHAILGPERAGHAAIFAGPVGSAVEIKDGDPDDAIAVPPGSLIEVRVEIDARHATTTRLAPIKGSERLIGRTVLLRE